jgi:4-hydroxy-tetrahydrodipicolinate synthase
MSRYNGIIPPLVTPLEGRDTLDQDGFKRLINRVVTGGVHGIFILGTTGEGPSLSYRLRREVIRLACKEVDKRIPVFVGITDTSSVESVNLAEYAFSQGADALVLTAPFYFPAGQTELIDYIEDMVPRLKLPLILYNMPSMTKIIFEIDSLKKLSTIEGIVGVKDSSGDIGYFRELCKLKQLRPDWSILLGPEALLTVSMDLGGDGGISGGANVFPRLFVRCYEAKRAGNVSQVAELNNIIDAFQEVYTIGKYASKYIKATKCCLSILGVCDDFMERPFNRFYPQHRAMVEAILNKMNYNESY